MDPIILSKCSNLYEKIMSSPLGQGITNHYYMFNGVPFFQQIRNKLEDNSYSSPSEWIEDVRTSFNMEARNLGTESEVSLLILTLLQMINEEAEPLLPKEPKNTNNELQEIIKSLKDLAQDLPNNITEFKAMLNMKEGAIPAIKKQKEPEEVEKFDPNDISQEISQLKSDDDLQNIADILTKYETNYTHQKGVIEIDLSLCSPTTLKLIHNYIVSKKNE